MIVTIKGILTQKRPDEIIIDVHGLGYACYISTNTYDTLPDIGKEASLLTYFHVIENNQQLFAFSDLTERELFMMLIGVSGIGPKIAIQLLSTTNTSRFSSMIINSDVKMLSSLPGIGPKTAKRLIIELKDKFTTTRDDDLPVDNLSTDHQDAYNALISLGYKSKNIENSIHEIISSNNKINTEDLIKACLKKMQ